jgi:MYXO-CTERM domain-containing protein
MAPIPGGFPANERTPNQAQIRVSQTGLAAVTADPGALIEAVTGGPLTFDVPENCSGSPSTCCPGGNPVTPCGPIAIDLTRRPGDAPRLVLAPVAGSSRLNLTLRARVTTVMDVPVGVPVVGDCGLHINTEDAGADDIIVNMPINFVQDTMAGTTRIEAGTATIEQLDNGDVALTGSFGCQFASLGIGFFIGTLTDTFAGAISEAVNGQTCKACPSGNVAECGSFATACTDNVCMKTADVCLQELGVTGRLAGGALLPGGAGALDLYEVLGGYATTDNNGIALGMLGGMLPGGTARDRCGPSATPPARVTVPQSNFFTGNTRPDTNAPFDIGIGVHKSQLDQFAYAGYEGGLLCMTISHTTVDLLTTDTFSLFLQSLPNLSGGTRGLALGLRPQKPPTITLGLNTFMDDGNGNTVVDEPLLDLMFDDLEIDFFAQIEDQYIRIFTLVADVHLPIGLEVGATGELTPVLGAVENAFTNLTVKNSEPLVESPAQLAAIFPMILDLALPQIIGGLGAFQVPELAGLQISVTDITAVDNKAFLAIYGELAPAAMARPARVETTAVMVGQHIPGTETFDDPGRWKSEARPRFELALGGSETDLEWSVRIDQGTWSAWSASPRRTLSSHLFWLQGKHQVQVRARKAGEPLTTDLTPVTLDPVIDTLAPVPSLETDGSIVRIGGTDMVSGDKLTARWRLQKGAWHEATELPVEVKLGKAQPIELEVEMYDEAGNMAPTRGSQAVFRADFHGAPGESGCNCGASGDPRGAALLFVVVALFLLRRPRRATMQRWGARLSVLLVGGVLPACSCGNDNACGDVDCMPGEVVQGPIGRWNSIAGDGTRTVITTYDTTLGDLVLADVSSSGELSYKVLDGIPDETPLYDPSGYRGGIEGIGPDVGAWTSVGLAGGLVRAAYQDRERKALRFVVETQKGRYAAHDVDVPEGNEVIGLHTSLVVGSAPAIAYVVTGVPGAAGTRTTELRLARASSATPSSPGDWNIVAIATAPSSCGGMCGSEACVAAATEGDPETCAAPSGTCNPVCADTDVCVAGACRAEIPDPKVEDIPGGTGLFPTLMLMPDGRMAVVFYDRVRTALVALVESGPGSASFTETILDGADAADDGMWASAAVDASGTIHVAYQDALGDQLMYTTLAGTTAGTPVVVDDGVRQGDRTHSVGAGAAIWLSGGSARIAYQDAATANLVVATQSGTTWSHADLATGDLMDGFHISALAGGGRLVWDQLDKTHSPPHILATQTSP